jgi:hypothetical protein
MSINAVSIFVDYRIPIRYIAMFRMRVLRGIFVPRTGKWADSGARCTARSFIICVLRQIKLV